MAHPQDIYTKSLLINFYFIRSFLWPSILKLNWVTTMVCWLITSKMVLGRTSEANGKHTAPRAILVLILWDLILMVNKVSSNSCALEAAQAQQKAAAHHSTSGFICLMLSKFSKCLLLGISSATVLQLQVPSNRASLKLMMLWEGELQRSCRSKTTMI